MKPSDFYLSSRQIFGTLIPGVVWIALLCVWYRVDFSWVNGFSALVLTVLVVCLFFAAYVIGLLLNQFSFKFTEYFARFLNNLCEKLSSDNIPQMREDVRTALTFQYLVLTHTQTLIARDDKQWWGPKKTGGEIDQNLFLTCKCSVICRSPELMRTLLEEEDEINIFAMLPLPLVLLTVRLLLLAMPWRLSAFSILVAALSVFQFQMYRVEEEVDCYRLFLLLETALCNRSSNGDTKNR